MEDLTGLWRFTEEFDYGKKEGELRLFQNGEELSGTLVFKECDENNDCIMVRCSIVGKILGNKLMFKDHHPMVLMGKVDDQYLPEEREGVINELGQIVGSAIDADGVSGIFVMERIK